MNWNTKKTHCKYGHEFTLENTYKREGKTWRICRTCRNISKQKAQDNLQKINYEKNKKNPKIDTRPELHKYKYSEPEHKKYIYNAIKYRIKNQPRYRHRKLLFTFNEFSDFIDKTNWIAMRNNWIENGYQKGDSPSVDRVNNKGNYTLDNIQIITMRENIRKYNLNDRIYPKRQ